MKEYAVTILRTIRIVDTITVEAESKESAEAKILDGVRNLTCPEIEAHDWISIMDQHGPFWGDYEILEVSEE